MSSPQTRSNQLRHPVAKLVVISLFAVVFGICGLLYFSHIHGATPTASFEADSGVISAPATKISDTAASGGQAVVLGTPAATGRTLLNTTFNNFTASAPMSVADYKAAMGDPTMTAGTSNLTNTSLVAVNDRGLVMRQILPANAHGGGSGMVTFPKLSQSVDEATIQYDIRFASDFDWGWGGKLPGLGGASGSTTPGTAAGCNSPNGEAWSGRGMWITPGSYGSVTGSNEWIGYMYNYNKTDPCGDNIRTHKAFVAGTWHTVKQYYKLNTPGQANGIHRMWLDGAQIINNTSYLYRNSADLHINYMFWAIFRGGGTADWDSPRAGAIDFDNILITTP